MEALHRNCRTVLVGGECACVYVDVRVDLDGGHMQSARLQDCAYAACDDAFTNARDDSSGDQDVFHHCAKGLKTD